ncbi:IS481 family transposase, partial [Niveispirillum sp. SYP-B3756]|nr:IS481 family transposase [Niveispirillum sp. SYP-B3756]
DKTPLREAVDAAYDSSRERIRIADYRLDTAVASLK